VSLRLYTYVSALWLVPGPTPSLCMAGALPPTGPSRWQRPWRLLSSCILYILPLLSTNASLQLSVPPAEPQFCIARVTSIRQFLTFVPLSDPLRSTHYQTPSWWIPLGSEGDVLFSTLVPSGLLSLPTFTSGAVCLTQPWVVPRHSLALVVSRKGFARAVWESFASSDLPRSMRPHMAFLMRHSRSPLHFPSLQI